MRSFANSARTTQLNSSTPPTEDCPVNLVSWHDAAAYCNWLSEQEGLTRCYDIGANGLVTRLKADYLSLTGYRLPTEAEWEYACRAGAATSRYYGETEELLAKYAWYAEAGAKNLRMRPVGSLKPNDLGLFDMLGNALEWCHDPARFYHPGDDNEKYYNETIVGNNSRVLRGGSFNNRASNVRSAIRSYDVPANRTNNDGFRPARTFPP